MKRIPLTRILLIAAMCVMILSTAGAATISAKQPGSSPQYNFNVTHNGTKVGQIHISTVNATQSTYNFTGQGLKANTKYTLKYTATSGTHTVGTAAANKTGVLKMHGTLSITKQDLQAARFVVT
ncbi:MAG: hypothetical protein ACXVI3_00210 [Halobacteriota archaeon]